MITLYTDVKFLGIYNQSLLNHEAEQSDTFETPPTITVRSGATVLPLYLNCQSALKALTSRYLQSTSTIGSISEEEQTGYALLLCYSFLGCDYSPCFAGKSL